MTKFYETVLAVLKQDDRFFTEEGILLRNAVYEAAMQMDTNLIHLLLTNNITKEHFFKEVDGIEVFDKVEFGWVVNNTLLKYSFKLLFLCFFGWVSLEKRK